MTRKPEHPLFTIAQILGMILFAVIVLAGADLLTRLMEIAE